MSRGWSVTTIGEVAEKRTDFTKVVEDGLYDLVGVQRSGWGLAHKGLINSSDMKFTKLMRLQAGNLVYRTITAYEAPSTVVSPEDEGKYVTPQAFPVFRLNTEQIMPQYMALLTTHPGFHQEMSDRCTGSVLRRKTLSVDRFMKIPIAFPPLDEQERIVDLIGSLDDAIEAAEGAVGAAAALFDSLIERLVVGAHGESAQLADVAVLHYGKPMRERDRIAGSIPVVGSSGIFGRHAESNVSTSYSIVVGRKGTAGSVTWFNQPVWATDTSYWVEPKTEVDAKFLYLALVGSRLSGLSAQTGVPGLNRDRAYSARITLPPLAEQKRVASLMTSLECAQEDRRRHADALRSLRAELLNALLSGAHAIPESYDEPVLPAAA